MGCLRPFKRTACGAEVHEGALSGKAISVALVCPYLRLVAKVEERRPVRTGLPVAAGGTGRA